MNLSTEYTKRKNWLINNTLGCEKLYVPKGQGKRCPITLLDLL